MDFEEFHVRAVMKLLREIILPRLCDLEQGIALLEAIALWCGNGVKRAHQCRACARRAQVSSRRLREHTLSEWQLGV